jgi:type IV pilus assembly protein PilB
MMIMNGQIRDLAFKLAPISDLRKAAKANGMLPLVNDGKIKVLKGMTTPAEVAANTQVDLDNEPAST